MIAQLLGQVFLREVPRHLLKQVDAGNLKVYGSIIRDISNGRIAGYLQEAAPMAALLTNPAAAGAGFVTKIGLQAGNLVENELIRQGVTQVEEGMGRLEHGMERLGTAMASLEQIGVANLALGAVGVGVSAAGFAVVSAKIDRVKRAVDEMSDHLSAKIDEVLHDPIKTDLDDLRSLAKGLDEGWRLADAAAERRWHDVALEALKFQERFERRAGHQLAGQAGNYGQAEPMLDAFAMANGLRVAALGACDEVNAACEAAADGTRGIERLTGGIGMADLVRHELARSTAAPGTAAWEQARTQAMQSLQPAAQRLRDREAAVTTRAAALPALQARNIRPRDWLRSAREEQDAPLLLTLLPEG
jgi:hypothetical protein